MEKIKHVNKCVWKENGNHILLYFLEERHLYCVYVLAAVCVI